MTECNGLLARKRLIQDRSYLQIERALMVQHREALLSEVRRVRSKIKELDILLEDEKDGKHTHTDTEQGIDRRNERVK